MEAVALDPAQPGTIYAVTHYDAALLVWSTDGGATWEELPSGITGQPLDMGMGVPGEPSIRLAVDPGDPSRLYQSVLGDQSGVLAYSFAESADQGQTWTVLGGAEADRARAVLEAGPGTSADSIDALMALTGGALPPPPDWMPVGSHVMGAAADDPPALYAFGGSGVYKSTDAGATWNAANSGLGYAWVEGVVVDPASPSTIYACTKQGIGKSIDGGATWDTVYEGSAGQLMVAPSHTSTLYAWTSVGLLRSDDGGATWDERACAGLADLAGNVAGGPQWMAGEEFRLALVAADAPDTLYVYDIFGSGETSLYRSTDGGDSWEPCATGGATVLGSAVTAPSNPSIVYAAGTLAAPEANNDVAQSAGLLTSKDGGASWTYQEAPAAILAIAVDAEDPAALYILCGEYNAWVGALMEGSTIYRSGDAGSTWQKIDFEHIGHVEWISADPRVPGVLYAASTTDKDGDEVFRTEAHISPVPG